jgi:hypothetical protein
LYGQNLYAPHKKVNNLAAMQYFTNKARPCAIGMIIGAEKDEFVAKQ